MKFPTRVEERAAGDGLRREKHAEYVEKRRTYYDLCALRIKPPHYYRRRLAELYRFLIPRGARVLELGCAGGDLLAALEPSHGVGVDLSPAAVELARRKHPQLEFVVA